MPKEKNFLEPGDLGVYVLQNQNKFIGKSILYEGGVGVTTELFSITRKVFLRYWREQNQFVFYKHFFSIILKSIYGFQNIFSYSS